MKILLSIVANAVALFATAYVVPGITFAGSWVQLLVAGAIFGLLNLIVRPLALLLSLPLLAAPPGPPAPPHGGRPPPGPSARGGGLRGPPPLFSPAAGARSSASRAALPST